MSASSAKKSRLAKRARGECERCTEPVSEGTLLCEVHRASRAAYLRAGRARQARLPLAMLRAWATQAVAGFALREPLWAAALRARGQAIERSER